MSIRVQPDAEVLPGYRLLERLGEGSCGEVWKAETPGGFLKAIKIVHGESAGLAAGQPGVSPDLNVLERLKAIRHPFILALESSELVAGQLILVMELADRSLWQRFQDCRASGLAGIPRSELLRHLEEVAAVLDMMNQQHGLQHLDLKPQNIFLLYNHVKVGDFGLVRDLQGLHGRDRDENMALYTAPEMREGVVSRWCDQYSLAVIYQELLTGRRPFASATRGRQTLPHRPPVPDLTALPPGDREPVARALARQPEARYPTCLDFVRALGAATGPGTGTPANTVSAPTATVAPSLGTKAGRTPTTRILSKPALKARQAPVRSEGLLFPALVVGLGGVGLAVLQQFRQNLCERLGSPTLPNIRLLEIDTDPGMVSGAMQANAERHLSEQEILLTPLRPTAHYLKAVPGRGPLDAWMGTSLVRLLPREPRSSGGVRAFGRLAFVDNYQFIQRKLRVELDSCTNPVSLASAHRQCRLGMRTNQPRVYLVTNLAGGTGGMFLDMAYLAQRLLEQLGWSPRNVDGVFLLPPAERDPNQQMAQANTVAALVELNHFSTAGVSFFASYHDNNRALSDGEVPTTEPPFRHCYLVPLPSANSSSAGRESVALAADFLYRDLLTVLGRTADEYREAIPADGAGASLACHLIGEYRLCVPRRELQEYVAQCLCHRLAQGWLSKNPATMQPAFQAWIAEQWQKRGLSADCLLGQLDKGVEQHLGQPAQAAFDALIGRFLAGGPHGLIRDAAPVAAALAQLEILLGRAPGTAKTRLPGKLPEALSQAGQTVEAETIPKLSELPLAILQEPLIRIVGAEDTVFRQLAGCFADLVRQQENLGQQGTREADDLYKRIETALGTLQRSSFWGQKNKAKSAAELLELLPAYPQARYRSLLQQQVSNLYQSLMGKFPKQFPNVNCCRTAMLQFVHSFDAPAAPDERSTAWEIGHFLLPAGCPTIAEEAALLLAGLSEEQVEAFAGRVHAELATELKVQGHHLCTATPETLAGLQAMVHREAEACARVRVDATRAAEIYLEQTGAEQALQADLARAFRAAAPGLGVPQASEANEIALVALPEGSVGERLRDLAARAIPELTAVFSSNKDELVFYREQPRAPLAELPQLGPIAWEAYRQRAADERSTPHSRLDVINWLPCGPQ